MFNQFHLFQYGPTMRRYYYRNDYFGRIVQKILLPPMTAYTYDKSSGQPIRKATYLPPRLSLRPLAGHKFLCYMIIGAIIANIFGYNVVTFIFAIFSLWFLFICVKAIGRSTNVQNRSVATETRTQPFSLNDSY